MHVTDNGEVVLMYRVHSSNHVKQSAVVDFMGSPTRVDVPAQEVELVGEAPSAHGTLTLRFLGPEVEAVSGVFTVDDDVELVLRRKPHVD